MLSGIAIESATAVVSVRVVLSGTIESVGATAAGTVAGVVAGTVACGPPCVRAARATATRAPMPTTAATREVRRERESRGVMELVRVEGGEQHA